MNSYDRTLIRSLGFEDKDKSDSKHDLACRYLSLPENSKLVTDLFLRKNYIFNNKELRGESNESWNKSQAIFEHPISKVTNQYKTTIGFLDLVLLSEIFMKFEGTQYDYENLNWKTGISNIECRIAIIVEVKIAPVPIGTLLRQMKLYREYQEHIGHTIPHHVRTHWLAATAYGVTEDDISTLSSQGISHVRLGSRFDEYVVNCSSQAAKTFSSPEV